MDEVIVNTRGALLRWHGEEVSSVADAGDLPLLLLGSEVTCSVGRTTLKHTRKMSPPKDFKHARGLVAAVHVLADEDDRPYLVELGVQTERGFAWFSPGELTLTTTDRQEVPHAS